ncbi:MAG: hypothetical protein KAU14_04615, partial [Thermoplasmata archaeon]|nr:hypothetical protein [Thermoplasmata archaeon]
MIIKEFKQEAGGNLANLRLTFSPFAFGKSLYEPLGSFRVQTSLHTLLTPTGSTGAQHFVHHALSSASHSTGTQNLTVPHALG